MARGVNKAIIVGNLGDDPKVTHMPDGSVVANFSVATSESWMDKNSGNREERTEWHRIVAFRRLGGIVAQYLKKGSKVYVEGRLQTRTWKDDNGADRYVTEIVANELTMLGSSNDFAGAPIESDDRNTGTKKGPLDRPTSNPTPPVKDDFDFDVPF